MWRSLEEGGSVLVSPDIKPTTYWPDMTKRSNDAGIIASGSVIGSTYSKPWLVPGCIPRTFLRVLTLLGSAAYVSMTSKESASACQLVRESRQPGEVRDEKLGLPASILAHQLASARKNHSVLRE